MPIYKQESLEQLRQRIDLAEVLSSHLQMQRAGTAYKALCPFHDEKTPSFMVQKGDSHYHCFGCGAHGDAIAFLMGHLKMGFTEAVESLAERFQVILEKTEEQDTPKGPSKALLKQALEKACRFYHFSLLYADEGREALHYLFERGITLDFIRFFQVGFAPKTPEVFRRTLHAEGVSDEILEQAGLLSITQTGRKREFFSERITFPIRDSGGAVIGFSARKIKEEVFGGKYVNTPETPLFKKSQVLFGLSYCRQRIAKERRAIIVEGQIDALRLIHEGFDLTVAGQGTAFGEGHFRELHNLGVNHVYLALDGDKAGQEATVKIGDLFQKKGVEVAIVSLPEGKDPDSLLREKGPPGFLKLLEESCDYLTFLYRHLSKSLDPKSPSKKNECVETIAEKIRAWEHPVMVHESLRKLAELAQVPEASIGVGEQYIPPAPVVKKVGSLIFNTVNPHRILETDLLRWLFLAGETQPEIIKMAAINLKPDHFWTESCRRLFNLYLSAFAEEKPRSLLSLAMDMNEDADQALLSELMQKKINLQKAEEGMKETIHKLLLRQWMEEREAIKTKIQSGSCTEEELIVLAKQFDEIKKNPPQVQTHV